MEHPGGKLGILAWDSKANVLNLLEPKEKEIPTWSIQRDKEISALNALEA